MIGRAFVFLVAIAAVCLILASEYVVFSRDQKSGRLTPAHQRISLPSPVCLRFRAHG